MAASRFNGGDDGTFDEGAVQELYLPVVQAFSDHFCRHDGTAHIHDAGDAIALIYGFDSRRDFLETRSQAAVFESAGASGAIMRASSTAPSAAFWLWEINTIPTIFSFTPKDQAISARTCSK